MSKKTVTVATAREIAASLLESANEAEKHKCGLELSIVDGSFGIAVDRPLTSEEVHSILARRKSQIPN